MLTRFDRPKKSKKSKKEHAAIAPELEELPRMPGLNNANEQLGSEDEVMEDSAFPAEDEDEQDSEAADDDEDDLDLNLLEDDGEESQDDEGNPKRKLPPSVHLVKARMASAVRALSNWSTLGAKTGKSRSEVMDRFLEDVCEYYGYNKFLAEKLVELFPIDEVRDKLRFQHVYADVRYPVQAIAFLDASDTPRPITIRTNTLKTRRRELAQTLINRCVALSKSKFAIFSNLRHFSQWRQS